MFPAFAPTLPQADLPVPSFDPAQAPPQLATVKRLIWLYFWLLIFEGALRKWFLPSWSNPLLIVRDPVVILIYVFAGIAGVFPQNRFIAWILGLGVVSLIGSEIGGRGNLLVSLFGLRTNFLHLPLIFLLPHVFDRRDLEKMAKWFFITSIPMSLLVLAQFRAAPDAWINNAAGGLSNGQLDSSYGRIRPPGTFSFTSGMVCYLSVIAAFVMQTLMHKDPKNRKFAIAAIPALALMVGVSGSRTILYSMALIFVVVAVICVKKPAFFGRGIVALLLIAIAYFALATWSEFREGLDVHQARLEGGGGFKEGIFLRFIDGLLPISALLNTPFFGMGLGMGTNAASGFLYGQITFNLGEVDWQRIVGESGPLIGLGYIGLRLAILVHLTGRSFEALRRDDPLPLLLLSTAFLQILNGQFGVPMILGWAVFSGGLCLASTNLSSAVLAVSPSAAVPELKPTAAKSFRGRSVFADQLHGEIEDPDIARFGP